MSERVRATSAPRLIIDSKVSVKSVCTISQEIQGKEGDIRTKMSKMMKNNVKTMCETWPGGLFTGDPVSTSGNQFNRVISRPEESFRRASATPALLVTKNHSLLCPKVPLIMCK